MAVRPISQLPLFLEELSRRVRPATSRVVQHGAEVMLSELVLDTPVDTGLLRSNWRASLSGPAGGIVPPHAPLAKRTQPSKKQEQGNAGTAIALGNAVIRGFDAVRDVSLFIVNNVPYAGQIDDTGGTQSRPGWVRAAVMEGVNAVRTNGPRIFHRFLQPLI